ncbi:MAG TPA: DapH/DapD/GlmU-related protein [Phycisphaerae bacterium]|nr:DapH/DapD/GlmU-related protein [Phycisphaerae bacterium]
MSTVLNNPTPGDSPGAKVAASALAKPVDPCRALQGFLFLDLTARLLIWTTSFVVTSIVFASRDWWPRSSLLTADLTTALAWGGCVVIWLVLFNFAYVALLVVLRLPIPTPQPGLYPTLKTPNFLQSKDRQILYSCLIALLTKARYEAPFPAFLIFHISNLPPMRWLMGRYFGPRSRSCYVTDPVILDPSYVEIGRNVVIGSGANIAGHCQLPDMILLRKTVIEDDVTIGANSTIFGGVTIRRGAMLGAGSVVSPYTTIGPGEYWSGVPAVKIRDLPPPQYLAAEIAV